MKEKVVLCWSWQSEFFCYRDECGCWNPCERCVSHSPAEYDHLTTQHQPQLYTLLHIIIIIIIAKLVAINGD